MPVKNLTPYLFGAKTCSRAPPQPEMTLIVRAAFGIRPGEALEPLEDLDQGLLGADTYHDDDEQREGECLYPGDFADFKPRADLLLRGTCHALAGEPATARRVAFAVGEWSKELIVVGDREWQPVLLDAHISSPRPFIQMPLDYSYAFGGPGHPANPVGKGLGDGRLPNLERPDALVSDPADRPVPTGFGPINPKWPPRRDRVGKQYGEDYRKTRAPYYAADFDWRYFNCAPEDQQLPGFLRGDERVYLRCLHPAVPEFEFALPGVRVRCFVNDVHGRAREVTMSLDTLYVDMVAERLYLTWRGLDAVETDDMSDVTATLVVEEPMSAPPAPVEDHLARLAGFEADPLGLDDMPVEVPEFIKAGIRAQADKLAGREPAPDAESAVPASPPPIPGDNPVSALLARELGDLAPEAQAKVRELIAKLTEQTKDSDVDLHAALEQALARRAQAPPPPPPPMAPGQMPRVPIAKAMRSMLEIAERNKDAVAAEGREADLEKAYALARDPRLRQLDPAYDPEATLAQARAAASKPLAPPPGFSIPNVSFGEANGETAEPAGDAGDAAGGGSDAGAEAAAGAGRARPRPSSGDESAAARARRLGDEAAAGAPPPPQQTPDLDFSGQSLRGAAFAGEKLAGVNFNKADLTRARFAGADLSYADLSGANLYGADLTGATLIGANLGQARLSNANLAGAVLDDASLYQARAASADFSETSWRRVNASHLEAPGARFFDAGMTQSVLSEADLSGADLSKIYAEMCLFKSCNLAEAALHGSEFLSCDFEEAKLDGASFAGAKLEGVSFLLAEGTGANFEGAGLERCGFDRAKLDGASFANATGARSTWNHCSFNGSRFTRAAFVDAQFLEVQARKTSFKQADLPGVRFYKSSFHHCTFRRANLIRADFRKCRLERMDFSLANLYDAKLLSISGTASLFDGANLKRAIWSFA